MRAKILFIFILGFSFTGSIAQKKIDYQAVADSLLDARSYKKAIAYYDSALKINPNSEASYRGKGFCYYLLNQMDDAQQQYYKALKINPRCLMCEYRIIGAYAHKQQFEIALHRTDSVLSLYADTGKKYLVYAAIKAQKGNILVEMNAIDAAEALYDDLIKDYPDSSNAYFSGAEFNYLYGSKTKSLRQINKAIELDSSKAEYYFLKAKLYIVINRFDEALGFVNTCIRLDAANGEYYGYRGSIYFEQQKVEDAITDYKKALDNGAAKGFYGAMLSELYMKKEDMDSMCLYTSLAKEALEKDTTDPDYATYYASIAFQQEEYCNLQVASYYYQRGVAMFNLGLYDSAIAYYNTGLQKYPANPVLSSFRGNAYIVTGQWAKAEADFKNSLLHHDEMAEISKQRFRLNDPSMVTTYTKGHMASCYVGLSEAYLNQKQPQLAKAYADNALATLPITPDAPLLSYYNQLGRAQMAAGDYDLAMIEFAKITNLQPNSSIAYANMALATAYQAMNYTDTQVLFSFSEIWGNEFKATSITLTDSKLTKEQKDGLTLAITYCNKAIAAEPNQPGLHLLRAVIKKLAKTDNACADVQRAKALGSADVKSFEAIICK